MTATLAEHCTRDAAHMARVRTEYDHTKTDHALPYGCDRCWIGFVDGRSTGWDYLPDGTPILCGPCVAEAKRYAAQFGPKQTPVVKPKDECVAGHKMTEGNTYTHVDAKGQARNRCRACGRDREAVRKMTRVR